MRLIVSHALWLVAIAVVIGIGAALGLSTLLSSLLFGVGARDPWTILAVAAVLAIIAVTASALPAWRASRIEPSRTLRAAE